VESTDRKCLASRGSAIPVRSCPLGTQRCFGWLRGLGQASHRSGGGVVAPPTRVRVPRGARAVDARGRFLASPSRTSSSSPRREVWRGPYSARLHGFQSEMPARARICLQEEAGQIGSSLPIWSSSERRAAVFVSNSKLGGERRLGAILGCDELRFWRVPLPFGASRASYHRPSSPQQWSPAAIHRPSPPLTGGHGLHL